MLLIVYYKLNMTFIQSMSTEKNLIQYLSFYPRLFIGESNRYLKTAITKTGVEADAIYNPSIHKQHTLFAGTQVLQARNLDSPYVVAVVMRTGR